ncbi:MAG: sodium:proton antiporter NhaD [Kordiimonadaceae bacterium]|jgi:NhaD family Na+/H+ antiporter|nr:sodium:proton antiporter NhaD [Kordiimonadaceae bacterium]MBT6037473.1 sodium:proton antiporter NhaD [Kordiimonadaceae bacterium]MBT6328289.1 sodium:proton antiporter NhaD [Kordiimonadaceae bacterium]
MDLTAHWVGIAAIVVFVLSYSLVIAEEYLHLKKSIPVIFGAGVIWVIVAVQYMNDPTHATEEAIKHLLIEFGELFLFLLAAMTYVNSMNERGVFDTLRVWLVRHNFSYRQLFWITGAMSFFLSPIIDNLTTALVMCAVIMAVGRNNNKFVSIGFVNIVIAANAGGAFSPFGDITTLMVWQTGVVDFWTFFNLFLPSVVNYIIPATIMSYFVSTDSPSVDNNETVIMQRGAKRIILLFGLTIVTAVSFHSFLHIPPFLGMMVGLAYLKAFGYYLQKSHIEAVVKMPGENMGVGEVGDTRKFDSFREIARAEWDTLLFFFGVIMCVGGLGFIGYLALASELMYVQMGPTFANIMVGFLSAIVDNIPVMVAVLQMELTMDTSQWLLVTLTAGVGGSLLSIGSAAGIALMGQSQGKYTFFGHLKWTPVIALGYGASIWVHLWLNDRFVGVMP